jgi:hypothetical protein
MVLLCAGDAVSQTLQYRSPVPGSRFNSRQTNIILKSSGQIDAASLNAGDIRVSGSLSGIHSGNFLLSDDGQTMQFQPETQFEPSEIVTVEFAGDVNTRSGERVERTSFTFTVTPNRESLSKRYQVTESGEVIPRTENAVMRAPEPSDVAADSLPADFPKFTVLTSSGAAPGNYFLTTSDDVAGVGHFFYMIDNAGTVQKYVRRPGHVYDFKVQPNGLMSYADPFSDWGYAGGSRCVHRVLDSNFAVIDSFRAGNGYDADTHEFLMLPNGHVILHAYDIQYVDMSKLIAGGNPNAIVVGSIIQELDLNKNVVFQWRSWDHIAITETYMNTAASAFDYIHVNAYDVDIDGDLLLCFRNTCEIVKVSRTTGEMVWRMGGKKNQFTFIGENEANKPAYYTFQHSFKRLPNGNFMLFDNGNLHAQVFSRGVEYQIDQVNKTATMIWQYRHTPDVYAPTRGSIQKLANGNRIIGWGSASFVGVGKTMITELSPTDQVLFEMESNDKMPSYRALKFVKNAHLVPEGDVTIAELLPGNTYSFNRGDTNRTGISIKLTDATFGYNGVTVERFAYAPQNVQYPDLAPVVPPFRFVIRQSGLSSFTADVTFDSTVTQKVKNIKRAVIFAREFPGSGMFIPLTTVYDSVKRSLTVSTTKFGEFIVGVPDQFTVPPAPTVVTPLMNALVNQTKPALIRWSTAGHITGSHLQIALDSAFTSVIVNDSTLRTSYALWNGYATKTKYFWRAKASNELGTSAWSSTGRFTTAAVYLSIAVPTLNQKLVMNTNVTVTYENNFDERVNIRLYKNGAFALKIKDSTENTGRYVWKVPASGLAADSTYTIRISSALDSTVVSTSQLFTITSSSGITYEPVTAAAFEVFQNYPNPFNPSTSIRFTVPSAQQVKLQVYDVLGKEVAVLADGMMQQGNYSVTFKGERLPSGVYLYRLSSGSMTTVKRMLLVK